VSDESSIQEAEDFALLDRWSEGDGRAGSELLRRHTGRLVRFFDRKLDGPTEDLVQDTFEAAMRGRDRFRRTASFRSFLFGIARNLLFGALRAKHRVHGELDVEASCLADLGPTPSHLIEHRRDRKILLEALRRLPIDAQVMLELYHLQNLSGPELAEVLGIGERALRTRLHRAMHALRQAVSEVAADADLLASSWADFEGWAQGLPSPGGADDPEDRDDEAGPAV
jgi:RNA polymerase sigma factor (sigma-70 family)